MKTYDASTYSDWAAISSDFTNDLQEIQLPATATHALYGPCQITALKARAQDSGIDVYVTLQFETGAPRTFSLLTLFKLAHLILGESLAETLTTYLTAFWKVYEDRTAILKEEHRLKVEAANKAKEDAKKAVAEEQHRLKLAAQIRRMKPEAIISEPTTYYETIGWLARNASTISAEVPSDLEDWFKKNFGLAEHHVIDSSATTTGGHKMKYSVSFHASFKNEIPAVLQTKHGVKKKAIDSVAYIWDLIENYGFRFGKSQDVEAIRKCIPTQYMHEFEAGFGTEPSSRPSTKKVVA